MPKRSPPEPKTIANQNLACLRDELLARRKGIDGSQLDRLLSALNSYDSWWQTEFSREHDHFQLLGQDNSRRYLPFSEIRVRVAEQDSLFEIIARAAAAQATGARVIISTPAESTIPAVKLLDELTDCWAGAIEFIEETDQQLAGALSNRVMERIRYAEPSRVPEVVRLAVAEKGIYVADEPVLADGRIELFWYVREQSVCYDYHRYGNLGPRSDERRREPA